MPAHPLGSLPAGIKKQGARDLIVPHFPVFFYLYEYKYYQKREVQKPFRAAYRSFP